MRYTTIYRTAKQNRVILLKGVLEQNSINYRVLEESNSADQPAEVKIQVQEADQFRAIKLLKENGFISSRSGGESSVSMARFWLWLVLALFFLIIASILINLLWRG